MRRFAFLFFPTVVGGLLSLGLGCGDGGSGGEGGSGGGGIPCERESDCDDGNPCTFETCVPVDKFCRYENFDDNQPAQG
ncbi:MAG: hypothetical protein KC731_25115, partial [Myxococcales bacterium]|nr:hypothetical protein [Myxococcales bacterium]